MASAYAASDSYREGLQALRTDVATPESRFEDRWKAERLAALDAEYAGQAAHVEANPEPRLTTTELAQWAAPQCLRNAPHGAAGEGETMTANIPDLIARLQQLDASLGYGRDVLHTVRRAGAPDEPLLDKRRARAHSARGQALREALNVGPQCQVPAMGASTTSRRWSGW